MRSFGILGTLLGVWLTYPRNEYSAMNILYHIVAAHNKIAKYSVTLVAGGAVLGFDDQVSYRSRSLAHGAFAGRSQTILSRTQKNRR
jgi:hypothetical protein